MPHITPLLDDDPRRIGRYRISGRVAGMPGTGPVFLGAAVDGSQVTVTEPPAAQELDSAAARDRFAAEAAAARRVAPFCAAGLLDAGLEAGRPFLVSVYVPGPSLLEQVADSGPLPAAGLQALALGTAAGLAAIHQAGLVHGDFGPGHVVLGPAGPRVTGYGITPPYGPATPAADMRAWALTAGYAAAGKAGAGLDVLPDPLRQLAAACLGPDPAVRPTARETVRALLGDADPPAGLLAEASRRAAALRGAASQPGAFLPGTLLPGTQPPGSQSPGSQSQHHRPRSRRGRVVAAAVTAGAVVLLALIVVLAVHLMGSTRGEPAASGSRTAPAQHGAGHRQPSSRARPAASRPRIAGSLAGVWTGQVRQHRPADVFSVRVFLTAGAKSGAISYTGASFTCAGRLRTAYAAGRKLILDQVITAGRSSCADGLVAMQRTGASLAFSFRGSAGPAARGTLARQ